VIAYLASFQAMNDVIIAFSKILTKAVHKCAIFALSPTLNTVTDSLAMEAGVPSVMYFDKNVGMIMV